MGQVRHIPPNFIINTVKGWNTRLLYTYYGSWEFDLDYGSNLDKDNIFNVINTEEVNNSRILSKGQYSYPQYTYFFKSGKSIRVKGYWIVSAGSTSSVFNIRARINNKTQLNTVDIAETNNYHNHTFAGGDDRNDIPVYFEIIYSCVESDDSKNLYFQANGFYQYNYVDPNADSTNLANAYVPIWNSASQYILVGVTDDAYELWIDGVGSSNISNVMVRHMTIEELS